MYDKDDTILNEIQYYKKDMTNISFINVVSIFSRKWNSQIKGLGQIGSLSAATLQTGRGPSSDSLYSNRTKQ